MTTDERFINLTVNGRIFPLWIMKNFARYQLPKIIYDPGVDPCNISHKRELYKYQEFVGQYIGPKTPYNSILLYHGLGSGKTAISINIINLMYEYDPNINFILLIKASLRDDPWMKDLKIWLGHDPNEEGLDFKKTQRFKTIYFVHYDSPFADREFTELLKVIDRSKRTIYFVEEAHNFIRNVYSNINSKKGKRAQTIYDLILRDRQENNNNKLILISATPIVNKPFELSLLFNWLRPGTFPNSEIDFNKLFITGIEYPILNSEMKNYFQRRIMGLVSYYVGSNSLLFAKREDFNVRLIMSDYQYRAYVFFQAQEIESSEKAKKFGKRSQLYRTYTRQVCNFAFPSAASSITAELRPRPGKFKLTPNLLEKIDALDRKKDIVLDEEEKKIFTDYMRTIEIFILATIRYFENIKKEDEKKGKTIFDDLDDFKSTNLTFVEYWNQNRKRANLTQELYNCSSKMTAMLFYVWTSPGKVLIYSNYVLVEGLRMMKVYLDLIGFGPYQSAQPFRGYCEYHGGISQEERSLVRTRYNESDNIRGEKCLIILLSPSGVEGINLLNMRREFIMEPHWNEVRIQQMIGRGIRNCSHKDLPIEERTVQVFRFGVVKPVRLPNDPFPYTTDEYIESNAVASYNLNSSFLDAIKEVAVDCQLNKNENQINETYSCFKFPEKVLFGKSVGPAYVPDMKDDLRNNIGSNAPNTRVERVRVMVINGVMRTADGTLLPEKKYLFYKENGIVYDYDLHYPVGRIKLINNLPEKRDKNTYIISDQILIPSYHI